MGWRMLDALKFVKGAVSTKDFVPALTHFQIANGRVTGFNGRISLSAPIPLDIDCTPKAAPFVAAIEACTETAQLNLAANGKLRVRSGKFSAHVDCIANSEFPAVVPEGVAIQMTGPLLPALTILNEFTADDASRPWATGVLLDGSSAYATNNVVILEHWLGYFFPYRLNVPRTTVREMIRIGEEPVAMQATNGSITFHYSGERWLRSTLNAMEWPDVGGLFAKVQATGADQLQDVPEELFDALDTLAPFVDPTGKLWIGEGVVATAEQDGASVEVPGLPACSFNHRMLSLLRGVAKKAAFAAYPAPVAFYGDAVRGAIAGMR